MMFRKKLMVSFHMSYKWQDFVLDIFNFRYAFSDRWKWFDWKCFPCFKDNFVSAKFVSATVIFGRNLYFSKQSVMDVLEFLILKMRESNLVCLREGEGPTWHEEAQCVFHKLAFFVRNHTTLFSYLIIFTRNTQSSLLFACINELRF